MKVVVDTNVIISALYFGGKPDQILQSIKKHKTTICINQDILQEYHNTSEVLAEDYPKVDQESIKAFFKLLPIIACSTPPLKANAQICDDPDDDKSIYCALASGARIIISGDKHLLKLNGYQNIDILKPNGFIQKYL